MIGTLPLVVGPNVADQFEAIRMRHFDIRQDDVGQHLLKLLQGVDASLWP